MTAEEGLPSLGTLRQVETAREVLARLSESSTDGRLRDAIGLVRNELYDLLDEADRLHRKHVAHTVEKDAPLDPCAVRCQHAEALGAPEWASCADGVDRCSHYGPIPPALPIHRTEAGYPNCSTCDGGGCYDCTDPA